MTHGLSSSFEYVFLLVHPPSSTNEVNTAYGVSTTNTQVSPASTQVSTANLSDDTIYAFLSSQPNGSQLVYEDLEQIHEDDIEEIDLKWQLALLSMRIIRNKNREQSVRRNVNVEETSSKAMVAIDGAGFDWSYMADDEVPTNMALMAFSDSEITDKSRKGVGFVSYNAVPPPPTGLFSPPNLDLSYSGLEEFQQPEFEGYGPKPSKSVSEDISNEVRESPDAPLVEELVSDDKLEKKTVFPTVAKIEFVRPKQQEKPVRKLVKYAEMYKSQSPRGNQRNWNNQMSQQLGSDFVMEKVLSENNYTRVNYNYSSKKAHPSVHKNMVPRAVLMKTGPGHPQKEDQGYVDSGCSRHMTGNMSYLSDFKEFDGGYVTFRGGAKGGKITGKRTLKTGKLDFEDVYFVKELQFNLFSVSQMCDKKNSVLFTDTGCFVLSPDFKLADESQVLLKVSRKNNIYNVDMKNIVPKECDGPKWLFDIDVLTSINYLLVVVGTNSNDLVGMEESIGAGHSSKEIGSSQDYILMPMWKDGLLFDSSLKNASMDHTVRYSTNSKAFRVFNSITRIVEEILHVKFSEETPNIAGNGPNWLFDIDALTKSMNYEPVVAGNQSNGIAGIKECKNTSTAREEIVYGKDYILLPFLTQDSPFSSSLKDSPNAGFKPLGEEEKKDAKDPENEDSKVPNT
ncbi:hypothetical protein Tco_0377497 [Tanacetum coccineum]